MERYQKQMSELYLTEAGKQNLATALLEPVRPRRPRVWRRGLAVGIAAVLVLAVTAGALSPTVQELLSGVLGGFDRYAQTVEGSAEDQGIEVRVLSAMADSSMLVVYAEAEDLTQDRLDDALSVDGLLIPKKPDSDAGGITVGIFSRECIGYVPETKTALLKFTHTFGRPDEAAELKNLSLQVSGFQPKDYFVEVNLPDWTLTDQTMEGWYLTEENVLYGSGTISPAEDFIGALALEPGQTPADLGSELVALSSAGFGADGKFHLQFEVPAEARMGSSSLLSTLRSRYLQTLDLESGEGWEEANRITMAYNDPLTSFWFTRDGRVYTELVFPVGPDMAKDLLLESVYGSVVLADSILGSWEIPLTVETLPELRMPLSGTLEGTALEEMTLSPLTLTIFSDGALPREPVSALKKDGSEITARPGPGSGSQLGFYNHWEFAEPVELDELTGISVGMWFIPLENGAAGEIRPLL